MGPSEGIVIEGMARNVGVGFHSQSISYDLGGALGHIYGSLSASINGMLFNVILRFHECSFSDSFGVDRLIPIPFVDEVAVMIPDDGLQVDLTGDPLFSAITALLPLFKGVIKDQVTQTITNQL